MICDEIVRVIIVFNWVKSEKKWIFFFCEVEYDCCYFKFYVIVLILNLLVVVIKCIKIYYLILFFYIFKYG